jgi:hypothetical protein
VKISSIAARRRVGVVLTEDVVKIAGQQGRYAVGHDCCFSSLDRVPLALMYPTREGMATTTPSRLPEIASDQGCSGAGYLVDIFRARLRVYVHANLIARVLLC